MQSYTYRELQQLLKTAKNQGLTEIKLNAKLEILQAEYNRLYSNTETEIEIETPTQTQQTEFFAQCSQQAEIDRANETQEVQSQVVETEKIVAELAIATGYAVFQAKLAAYRASKPRINPIVSALLTTAHSFRKAAKMARSLTQTQTAPVYDYAAHRDWVKRAWKAA